jgi:outer membrane protein OmpA-like peptidoglycan-associated protein
MSKSRFAVAGMMAIVSFTFAGCGQRDLDYKSVECDELKRDVRDLEAELDACEKRGAHIDMTNMGAAADTNAGKEKVIGHGVTVGERPMETYITVDSSVLFKPGSAKLTTEAKATLSRIIEVINEKYPGHHVRIDGFTDNEPITRSKDKWDDNFDLSGGRGLSVLHYLEAHGIAAKDLGFAGFGQERPKASNSSESGRAKNRRVEIVVDPDMSADEQEPEASPDESKPTHHSTHHATHHVSHPASHSATSSSTSSTSMHATDPSIAAPISGSTNASSFATPSGSSAPTSSQSFGATPSGGTFASASPSATPAASSSLQAAPATTLTPGPGAGSPATTPPGP